jgi:hypothetical protein
MKAHTAASVISICRQTNLALKTMVIDTRHVLHRTTEQERRRKRAARSDDIERDPEVQQDDDDRSVSNPLENMAS